MIRSAPGRLDAGRNGRVAAFDEHRGLGVVETDQGERFSFHCTAIADGSRTIAEQSAVRFVLRPGHGGCLEADGITPH